MPALNQRYTPKVLKYLAQQNVSESHIDYQYIQKSHIPTMHFQPALPRLPVPDLKLTCQRYLAAQKPLLIAESYRKTETNVNRFNEGVGKMLQKMLQEQDRNNKHTSYISELWFDMYLKDRKPLPINTNPTIILNNDDKIEYNQQDIRTTNLIISSLRFYKSLKDSVLEPEIFHLYPKKSDTEQFRKICSFLPPKLAYVYAYMNNAFPLDMSQYSSLFKSTRIPETDKDRLFNTTAGRHITIQYKGNFFVFDVLTKENDIIPPDQILQKIRQILEDNRSEAEFPVGILTTLERNQWASIRHALIENGNELSIKLIDSALFHVCLDNNEIGTDPIGVTRNFLHSDGANRWFDKSFSLIITKDGVVGVNFEHAWGDGVAVLRYVQDIFKETTQKPIIHPDSITTEDRTSIYTLDFKLSDALKQNIKEARKAYKSICNNLGMNYVIFEGTGRKICKKNDVSADAIMQLGFQDAYFKYKNKFAPTYESCSTAAFKHGRTETIRPCTIATKDFVTANNSASRPPVDQLKQLIAECSKTHMQLTREAAMGQGFDRHMFALKNIANRNDIKCNVFDDPEYAHINHNIISTSTLNSPAVFSGGFGPVVSDGFGISYVIKDEFLGALVTCNRTQEDENKLISAMKQSFEELLAILQC